MIDAHGYVRRNLSALVFDNLPPGVRAEDNEAGLRLSLEQPARRFE
jgi:hypothetical protein